MNKKRMRCLGIIILAIAILIPIVAFRIQDAYTFNQDVEWDFMSKKADIIKKYPLISNIYSYYDSPGDEKSIKDYVIRNKGRYSKEDQVNIDTITTLFTQEINKLLKQGIISYDALELQNNQDYKVDFGTIRDITKEDGGYYSLSQIFRFNTEKDNHVLFQMDKQTGKIISMKMDSTLSIKINEAEKEKISMKMIQYLGLEDIEDWKYMTYGLESYQAKLQVVCQAQTLYKRQRLSIDIRPLGYTGIQNGISIW